jgi:bacillithiol system protein YtxJ
MSMLTHLCDVDSLEPAIEESRVRPVLLFKHSTMCPISSRAYDEVERFLEERKETGRAEGFDFGMIVVQTARPVSNRVAEQLGVEHESPQAIVVRDGRAVWHTSHRAITRESLSKALAEG